MRSPSKTVIAALVERRSARQERQLLARQHGGHDAQITGIDGLYSSQGARLLVHSRF